MVQERLEDFDEAACAEAVQTAGDEAWGVDINAGHNHGPCSDMVEATRRAVSVATAVGKPVMLGLRREDEAGSGEDWSLAEQLGMLRPGDVVTYCFAPRTQPTGIVRVDGAVEPAALEARERGVIFGEKQSLALV